MKRFFEDQTSLKNIMAALAEELRKLAEGHLEASQNQ
jgi:hypothetical protein